MCLVSLAYQYFRYEHVIQPLRTVIPFAKTQLENGEKLFTKISKSLHLDLFDIKIISITTNSNFYEKITDAATMLHCTKINSFLRIDIGGITKECIIWALVDTDQSVTLGVGFLELLLAYPLT